MMRVGERAWNLKRLLNLRLGLTRVNDTLPKALLKPFTDGGSAGFTPDLPAMLAAYYAARGWDPRTGAPTAERLALLGLHELS
jgi:aldehyde:ferredoxin oxidoreductase